MSDFMQSVYVLLGLFLRIAIPLGLSGLLGWFFYRLDLRWQAEAQEIHSAQIDALAIDPQSPCWQVMNCSSLNRENCGVYQSGETPCWERYSENGKLHSKCLSCVYPKLIEANSKAFA